MTPEVPHSDNVFARQMGVDLSFAGAHCGAPVLEYLDRGAVGDALCDAPLCVGGSHDGQHGSGLPVEHVTPDIFDKLSHQFPLCVYGYCPNGTRACGILSTKIGAEIKQLACVSVGGAELSDSPTVGQCSYFVPAAWSSPIPFASDPLPQTPDATPATSHVPNLGVASNLSRESAVQFGIHLGVQPCEEAYPAARIRQCGRLKQGTADGSRTPLIAEATGRRAAVNRPPVRSAQVSKIGASALKRQPWSVPPTLNAAGALPSRGRPAPSRDRAEPPARQVPQPVAPGMGGQR